MITTCSNSSSTNENTLPKSLINENEIKTFPPVAKEDLPTQMTLRANDIIERQLKYIKEIEEYMLKPSSHKNEKIDEVIDNQYKIFLHTKNLARETVKFLTQCLEEKERIAKMYKSLPEEKKEEKKEIKKILEKNRAHFFETIKQTTEKQEEYLKEMIEKQEEFRKLTNKTNL
jgi:hypothetical protein